MSDFEEALHAHGVVPVVIIDDAGSARMLGEALEAGGIHMIEVTLRTPAALRAIEELAALPGLKIGAGTVLDSAHAKDAISAGASFLVSPGTDRPTIDFARETGAPIIPGVATATEIQQARNMGLHLVKFFPCSLLGGAKALSAYAGVFRNMAFMPTGGITEDNLRSFLDIPAVAACGGTWIAPEHLIAERAFDEIENRARRAVAIARGAAPG